MKKIITIIILGVLPGIAFASGDHGSGDSMSGRPTMEKNDHSAHNIHELPQENYEGDAGQRGNRNKIDRTVRVIMDDNMRFFPDQLEFSVGETVRFAVHNNGKIRHEMVIGSMAELKEHAEIMRGNIRINHVESNMVTLAPGEYDDVIWRFDKPGNFDFACLVPGHLEAGMTGKIVIR